MKARQNSEKLIALPVNNSGNQSKNKHLNHDVAASLLHREIFWCPKCVHTHTHWELWLIPLFPILICPTTQMHTHRQLLPMPLPVPTHMPSQLLWLLLPHFSWALEVWKDSQPCGRLFFTVGVRLGPQAPGDGQVNGEEESRHWLFTYVQIGSACDLYMLPFSPSPYSHHTAVVRTSHVAPKPTHSTTFCRTLVSRIIPLF